MGREYIRSLGRVKFFFEMSLTHQIQKHIRASDKLYLCTENICQRTYILFKPIFSFMFMTMICSYW